MFAISFVVDLTAIGVAMWLMNRCVPMAGAFKSVLNGIAMAVVVVWFLQLAGAIRVIG